MRQEELLENLRSFYDKERIGVAGFDCRFKLACREDAKVELSRGAEAYVGQRFGEDLRIVILSLDTGGGSDELERRRTVVEGLLDPARRLNPHMRGTLRCVRILLGRGQSDREVVPYFAMTNAAKCSRADRSTAMVPAELYRRCRPFAEEELRLLDPDVVVTQGRKGRAVLPGVREVQPERLSESLSKMGAPSEAIEWLTALAREYLRVLDLSNRSVLVLRTPHPSARGGQWQLFERIALRPVAWMVRSLAGTGT